MGESTGENAEQNWRTRKKEPKLEKAMGDAGYSELIKPPSPARNGGSTLPPGIKPGQFIPEQATDIPPDSPKNN